METPFSPDELNRLISKDEGLKRFIHSLPGSQADRMKELFLNGPALKDLLGALPGAFHEQIREILPGITHVPREAIRLYEGNRYFEARHMLEKTLEIYQLQNNSPDDALNRLTAFVTKRVRAVCLHLLGEIEWALGNASRAGSCHSEALALAKEIKDPETMAKALLGLGTYHWHLGDLESAMSHCQEALQHIRGRDHLWGIESSILTTLSAITGDIGEKDQALAYAQEAVEHSAEKESSVDLSLCLNNLACIYCQYNELELAAEALKEALEVAEQKDNHRDEALILNNVAMVRLRHSFSDEDVAAASSCLDKALSLARQMEDRGLEALSMNNMGLVCQAKGHDREAVETLLQAIRIYRRLGSRADEASALGNLAQHLKDRRNDLENSVQACARAIDIIEQIRSGLKKETSRITYADKESDPYELMVDSLLTLGRTAEALEYVERAKSRALLDFLTAQLVDEIAFGSESEEFHHSITLLKEIDEIRANLEAIANEGENEFGSHRGEPDSQTDKSYPGELLDKLGDKEQAFDLAYSQLFSLDPEKASMIRVVPLSLPEMSAVLDHETLFLGLFQAEEKLYLFLMARDGFLKAVSVDLPAHEAYEMVENVLSGIKRRTTLDPASHDFIRDVRRPLGDIFDRIMAPFLPFADGYRRLIISPHLFWHYFPFHALYHRKQKGYLCDRLEIGYCPSASILGLCRQKKRTGRDHALILVRHNGDLPYAEREADLLAGAFDPGCCRVYKDDHVHLGLADRARPPYDAVHLACHGRFDSDHPFLSGLDIPPDENEERRTYLLDLFGLGLDCNLVTLSACDSGLSHFTMADELIGISRGLFYAGAAGVMLSLWQVSDESTCYFMENFYWHYVKNRQTKTRALQLAMQAVKARREYAHPFFWAPFVVMGDWR